MTIRVLGRGCGRCEILHVHTMAAVRLLGLDTPVDNVDDEAEIARAGVHSTPALVLDGRVRIPGTVPSMEVAHDLFAEARR